MAIYIWTNPGISVYLTAILYAVLFFLSLQSGEWISQWQLETSKALLRGTVLTDGRVCVGGHDNSFNLTWQRDWYTWDILTTTRNITTHVLISICDSPILLSSAQIYLWWRTGEIARNPRCLESCFSVEISLQIYRAMGLCSSYRYGRGEVCRCSVLPQIYRWCHILVEPFI